MTRLAAPDFLAARLGVANFIGLAVGGTGLLRDGSVGGNAGTFRTRILKGDVDASRIGDMSMTFMPGSVNDTIGGYSDAACQSEYAQDIALLKAAQPNSIIIGMGPQDTPAYPCSQARFDAHKAGFLAGAGGDKRCIYVDNSPAGLNILNSYVKANYFVPVGSGGTGYHLNDAGNRYYGLAVANAILAAIQSVYSL